MHEKSRIGDSLSSVNASRAIDFFFLYALSKRSVWPNCIVLKPSICVTTGNEVHTNLENHVPNALSTRKRQIGHASLSFFRSCPQFPPSTRNIKSKRCEEPTTRSYRQKKKNKKKSCLCTSVYCVLDNLKNFPWCVFRTVFSVSEYFRSASSPSILNESWRECNS